MLCLEAQDHNAVEVVSQDYDEQGLTNSIHC